MNIVNSLSVPVIYAHRGASKYAPENTIAAFELAYEKGAPAIELDTMLSKDGIPVVIHDNTVDRTTNGTGRVDQLNATELTGLDAGLSYSQEYKREPIPLLRDVFIKFKEKLLINVELKNYHAPFDQLPNRVSDLVKELGNLDALIFSSFNPYNLIRIKRSLPEAKTAILVEDSFPGKILSSRVLSFISPEFIHPYASMVTSSFIRNKHKHGKRVNVWTVNDLQEALQFTSWGVDGLITDDPEELIKLLLQLH